MKTGNSSAINWPPTERETILKNARKVAEIIPEDYIKVLEHITNHWEYRSVMWLGIHTNTDDRVLRRILKNLRQQGLIKLTCFVREDENYLAGSGYHVSDFGRVVLRQLGRLKDW